VAGSDDLCEHFALIGRALSSPARIRLLDLLCQGERSVEQLAEAAELQMANASAHLQILRRCHLVEVRRVKQKTIYRLADDDVARFYLSLREFARSRSAELERLIQDYITARDELEPVRQNELIDLMVRQEVVVIDVRPRQEYESAHIAGAISMPLDEIPNRIVELRPDSDIVAYCRGPYCVLSPQAVTLLRQHGLQARRLQDGLPEWRLAGLPIAVG
jgi:rhodanese-related sulfurtransferase/DNA-binding transcriptional ArsR family regulator